MSETETQGGRFRSTCPPPTPYQNEIGIILMEECAEVSQRMAKSLRFGVTERQLGHDYANHWRLGQEVGDLLEMIDRAIDAGLISRDGIIEGRLRKKRQLDRYLQTERGERMTPDGR